MVTIPNPNPIPNSGFLEYQYEVEPGVTLPGGVISNTVYTQVNRAIIQVEDGGLLKARDNEFVALGDTITYTITLKNTGNVAATLVNFKDTIPLNTVYIPGSATVNGTLVGTNPESGINVGTIGANATATVVFKVVVTTLPTVGNTIPNEGVVDYTFQYDPSIPLTSTAQNISNTVESYVNTAIINQGDGLLKERDVAEADIGDVITYTITVKNTGNTDATNVVLKDTIPKGTQFQSNNVTIDGTNTPGNPQTGVSLGTIAPGATKVAVFTVLVVSIPTPNPTENQGIINYNYKKDPNGTAQESVVSPTNIVQTSILSAIIDNTTGALTKAVDLNYAAIGDTITYTIKLENKGNIPATNVMFYDTIPNDTSLLEVAVNGTIVPGGDPQSGVNLGTILQGEVKTVTFKVKVDTIPTPNPIPNQGKTTFDYLVNGTTRTDTNLTNIVQTTVAQARIINGDGGLVKSVDKTNAEVSDTLTYTIVLKNTGNVNALNVLFKDTVPAGTSLVAGSVKVDGVVASGNLTSGITVGTIAPNTVKTVTFNVIITTIPSVNPIPNEGIIDYQYTVDPSSPNKTATEISNQVQTTVKIAVIDFSNGGGLSKERDLSYAKVGDIITYTIPVSNTGNIDANNVVLKDTIPSGTSYVTGSLMVDGASNAGNIGTGISLGTISPNVIKTVTFKVKIDTIPTPNPIPNSGTVSFQYSVDTPNDTNGFGNTNIVTTTVAQAYIRVTDGGLLKTVNKAFADVGEEITYTLILKNTGNVNATNVKVFDTIPNDTSFVTGSVTGGTGTPSTGITVGTILPNETKTVTFRVKVDTIPTPNPIPNTGDVTYDYLVGTSTVSERNTTNAVTTKVNTAIITNNDGGLTKSVDKAFGDIGDIITYTIVVKNTGNVEATNVIVKDTIPNDTTFVTGSLTVDGTPSGSSISTGVNIGTVSAGASKTVVFKVKVNTIPNPNPIPNDAKVSYSYKVDPASTVATNKEAMTNLVNTQINTARITNSNGSLVKSVDKGFAEVGEELTYTIVLKNTGNVNAFALNFKDTIPNNTSYVSGSALVNGSIATGDPTVGIVVGTVTPNEVVTINFKVKIDTIPTPNPIPNQGKVSYSYVVDPVLGTTNSQDNLTNTVQTTVANAYIRPEDGGFLKTVSKADADVGDVLTYTIQVKNTGNVPANNVVISDTIPNDTSYVASSLKVNNVVNPGNIQTGISLGTIAPGSTVTVVFQVTVDRIPNPNPIVNEAKIKYDFQVGTETRSKEDLTDPVTTRINNAQITNSDGGLVKSASKDFAKIGDTITYTINLQNTGNITANNIILKDTIPTATNFVLNSVQVNGSPVTGVNPSTGVNVGSLAPGATAVVTFDVTVTTIPVPNPVKNQALVNFTYTVDPLVPNGKSGSGISNVVPTTINTGIIASSPEKGIVKSVDKAFADIGTTITYTIALRNSGNVEVKSVILKDTIPMDTSLVAGSVVVDNVATTDNPETGITVGNILSGATKTIQFKVVVNTIPTPNPIPNEATVNYNYEVNPVTGETASSSGISNLVNTQVNTARITNNDGGLTKSVDKAFGDIGDIITYTIVVKNTGNVEATNVIVKDTIPNDTTFVTGSLTVDGTPNGSSISTGVNIGTVSAGASKTVVFKVKVNTIPNPNPIPNDAKVSYSYKVDPASTVATNKEAMTNLVNTQINTARITNSNGSLVKSVDKADAKVGEIVTYTIVLKNTGNVSALNVKFYDTIPNDTSYVSGSALVNGTSAVGTLNTGITIGTMAVNEVVTVKFQVVIDTIPTPNPIPNQGKVSYDYVVDTVTGAQNTQNNLTNTVNTQVSQAYLRPEDGSFVKTVDKKEADVGDILTYTIVLNNKGNVAATNVIVKDTIPNDTTLVSNSLKVNGTTNSGNIETGINIGTVNPSQIVTIVFQVKVDKIPNPNPIVNEAVVSYNFLAGTLPKSESHITTPVTTKVNNAFIDNSNGSLVKSVDKEYAKVGDVITYTINLTNSGNVDANNVVLKDTIPSETTFVTGSVVVDGSALSSATPSAGIPVGTILPGATSQVSFKVLVVSIPTTNPIKNMATVGFTYTVDQTKPNGITGSGASNIVSTTINTAKIPGYPEKGIVKSVDMKYADVGDIITYTIVMKNEGNVPAINVTLQDTVPNDTTFVAGSILINGAVGTGNPNTGIVIPSMPANSVATVSFKVKVDTLPNPNPIPNDATVNYEYIVNPITGEKGTGADTSNKVTTQVNTARIAAPDGGLIKNVNYLYADVGQTLTYTILLNNTGNIEAINSSFLDTVPNDTTFVPGSVYINGINKPGANPNTGIYIGTLAPFSANTVQFQVKIDTLPNPNPIPNDGIVKYGYITNPDTNVEKKVEFTSNKVTTQVNNANIDAEDGGLIKTVDKNFGAIGDTLTYTIVLKNTGNVDAINVLFRDTIPNSTTFITGSATVNGIPNLGADVQGGIPIGTVPPNTPTTITFKVKVIDTLPNPNPIPNTGRVSYEYIVDNITQIPVQDGGESNKVETKVNVAIINNTDGTLSKMANKVYVDLGDTITYTVVIGNTGNTVATNVFFRDTIPEETTFVINSVNQNGSLRPGVYPETGFILPNINPGDIITITFDVTVTSLPMVNPIKNKAFLGYSYKNDPAGQDIRVGYETNIVENFVNRAVIEGSSDGSLVKTVDKAYAKVGDQITYTISIKNTGNVTAENLVILDTIPSYTSFVTGSVIVNGIPSASMNPQTGINVGNLAALGTAEVKFKVLVVTIPPTGKIPNDAVAKYNYTVDPSIPGGSTGGGISNIVTTTIGTAVITGPPGTTGANNGGTKTASPSPANIGDTVTYSIAVYNGGNVMAENVKVYDTTPSGSTFIVNSVTVNGTPNLGETPETGMTVGTLNPGATKTVSFKVIVNTLVNPGILTNTARIDYKFTTDPSIPGGSTGTGTTNPVTVPINTATFGNLNGENGLIKSVDKMFAKIGDTVTYTIDVKNLGNTIAIGVVFEDTIPLGTQFIQDSLKVDGALKNGASPDSGVSLGNIVPGGKVQVEFKVKVMTIPNPNPFPNEALLTYSYFVSPTDERKGGNLSNIVKTQVNTAIIGEPLEPGTSKGSGIIKTATPQIADVGDTITYTLVAKNTGNVNAENVIVKDIIPIGTTFVNNSVTVNGTSEPGLNPTTGIDIGIITPGNSSTITFKVLVVSIPDTKSIVNSPSGELQYTVDPSNPGGEKETFGGNTVTIPVNNAKISNTDGGLVKYEDKSFVTIGDEITYTIVLKNTGSIDATSVKLYDTVPNGTSYVINSIKVNGSTQNSSLPGTGITIGTIKPNETATVLFKVLVTTVPIPNPIVNTADVAYSYQVDSSTSKTVRNTSNEVKAQTNYVDLGASTKDGNPNYVKVGDVVTYTITIPNSGNVAVNNVVVKDTLPNGTTFVTDSATVGSSNKPGENPFTTGIFVGTIGPNNSEVVTFKVLVVSVPSSGKLTNQARFEYTFTKDPASPDGVKGTEITNVNTVTVTNAEIVGPPGTEGSNSGGTKTASKKQADLGDIVTYTITLQNSGNVKAENVVIYDTIPECTTLVAGSVLVNGTPTTDTPGTGIKVGTINPGAIAEVKYSVKVTCLKTPPPAELVNKATVNYEFTTDPSLPKTSVTKETNVSTIPVTTASFGNINGENGIIKSVDKVYADRGDIITYTIDLKNLGNTNATSVVFKDTIPKDTQFVVNSLSIDGVIESGANPQSGVTIGTIAPGASKQIKFKVLVLTIPSINPIPNEGVVSYKYTVDPSLPNGKTGGDISNKVFTQINTAMIGKPTVPGTNESSGVLKSSDTQYADIGDTVTYTFVLKNTGNVDALNVILRDTIPVGSTFINDSVTINGTQELGANPQTGITLGNIAPNEVKTVTYKTLVVSIPSSKNLTDTPIVDYSYKVDPNGPETQVTGGGNTVTIPVNNAKISTVDGGLKKSASPEFVTIGDEIVYTVVMTNTGSVDAINVKVLDTLQNGVVFVLGSAVVNGTPKGADNPTTTGISVGTVTPGNTATVTFKALVTTVPVPNPVKNTANIVYSYKPDPNTVVTVTNPTNTTETQTNYANIDNVSKGSDVSYVKVGDIVTYTITIPNTGNVAANNVVLKDTVPSGTTFVVNSVVINGSAIAGQDIQTGVNVGTINAGSQAVVNFKVLVVSVPASGKLVNQARLAYTFTKDPANPNGESKTQVSNVNTVTVSNAEITGPPGTTGATDSGTKVGSKKQADLGDIVTYTISLFNGGNVIAENVKVYDTIPECTSLVAGSVKVDGVVKNEDPKTGITVGTINPGQTRVVNYDVKVVCLKTPPPAELVNTATVGYEFVTDPKLPKTAVTGTTNTSTIPVTTATFGNINGQSGLVKVVDKAYADRGDILTYTIDVKNLGNTTANNVEFKDTIPNDTTFVQDSFSIDGTVIVGANPQNGVTLSNIQPGTSKQIMFKVKVMTIPNPNPIPNSAILEYTYTVDPSLPNRKLGKDLSNTVQTKVNVATIGVPGLPGTTGGSGVLKSADKAFADIGTTVTYTLVLKNTGNVEAKNVIVYDTIPEGSSFINDSVSVNNINQPGLNPQSGIGVGNIDPGVTVTINFKVVVVSIPTNKNLVNTPRVDYSYTVNPNEADKNISSGGNTVTIPVNNATISKENGGFTKSQDPSFMTIGDTITYTMVLKNTGSVNADNVKVYDDLDPALQFITGSVKVNLVAQAAANPETTGINVGTLSPGQVATVTFKALVITAPNPNPIKNEAKVSYSYKPDPNTVVTVTNPSNITEGKVEYVNIDGMTKVSDTSYVKLGDVVTYKITIPNDGNTAANNVVLKDTIPSGTSFVTNSATVNGIPQGGANPETTGINVGTINPGSSVLVEFKVTVISVPTSGKLVNQARANYTFTVDPTKPDGRTDGSVSNVNTVSVTNASIVGPPGTSGATNSGTKVASKEEVDIGDTVTYTISLYNSGNVPATDVVVKDTIPNCTTLVNGSVKVNGNTSSDKPETGINVGTINPGQTAVVKYDVKVTCLPTPEPAVLKNTATIDYKFTTDPKLPKTEVSGNTNTSTIPVVTASFGNINGKNGLVKSVDKAFAERGDIITYTIIMTNLGNTDANNVVFKDTIPNDTVYVQDSLSVDGNLINGASPNSGVTIGTVKKGESREVKFKVQVLTIPVPNPIPNSARVEYTYTVDPSLPNARIGKDLSNIVDTKVNVAIIGEPGAPGTSGGSGVLKSADKQYADIGDKVTYTLVLKNTGNTTAKNVTVYDTIPEGSELVKDSVTVNGTVIPGANPETGIDIGNIEPSVTVTVKFTTLVVSIPKSKALIDTPRVDYSYTVNPNEGDKNVTGGGNTVTIPVNNANISKENGGFIKSQDPSFMTIGDTVTYTMVLKNTGSVNATNVKVYDNLDPALQFVIGSVIVDGIAKATNNPETTGIIIGTLSPNAVSTITFKALVITAPNPNPIKNEAIVSYEYSPEPNKIVQVTNPSNITEGKVEYVNIDGMVKDSNTDYVKVLDIVTYTITIPNTGNTNANNVVLKDTIPSGTSFVANSAIVNGISQPGANPETTGINVGTIFAGNEAVVKFQVQVNSVPTSGKLVNQARANYTFTVDPTKPDGRTDGSVSNINTVSVTNASIVGPPGTSGATNSGTKVGSTKQADIGDVVTYTISLYNDGNVPATDVVVRDTIPNCTTLVNGSVTVNGVLTSDKPSTGINVGTINPKTTAIVKYAVKVTCLPTPAPAELENTATIDYKFTTDPKLPKTEVSGKTNTSTIPVTTASFGNINGENGIIKTVNLSYADVGDIVTFTIALKNLGNTSANNVVFKDTIPTGTQFVQDSVKIDGIQSLGLNPAGGISLGNIGSGIVKTIEFKVKVLEIPTENPFKNQASVSYNYTVDPSLPNGRSGVDLSNITETKVNNAVIGKPVGPGNPNGSGVDKSANPQVADIGDIITYTLVVANNGNVPAQNVVVRDTIPEGSVFIDNSVTVNGVVQTGVNIEQGVDLGNINPKEVRTVTFKTKVVSLPNSKTLVDTPLVNYSYQVDPNSEAKPAEGGGTTVTVPVNTATISKENGGIVKVADPSFVTIGDTITYTVVVKNTGSIDAENVKVFDTLQNGVVFVNGSVKINGVSNSSLNPISGITLGIVSPGQITTVTFKALVETVPNPNPISNTANVSYTYKPSPNKVVTVTNPSPTTETPVKYVDIDGITKTSDVNYVSVGDIVKYTVVIPNTGNVAANNVILKDTVPVGSTFIADSVTVDGLPKVGESVSTGINVGTISPGQSVTVTFKVSVVSVPATGKLSNQVVANYTFTVDPNEPNGRKDGEVSNVNTVTVTNAEIVGPPGTGGSNNGGYKSSDQDEVDINDIVTYTIQLLNSGNVPANNVVLKDTIPKCTEFITNSVRINGATVTGSNPESGVNVGTINPKQLVEVSYKVKVTCLPESGILENQATVNYNFIKDPTKPPQEVTTKTNTDTIPVVTASFGSLNGAQGTIKSTDKAFSTVGEIVTYTIKLTNLGNTKATNVKFVDTIPSGTSFVQDSVIVNGVNKPGTNPDGGINLGTIEAKETVVIEFKVKVLEIPTKNPIVNQSYTTYNYVVDPDEPIRSGKDFSNAVETKINYAVIGTPNGPGVVGGSGVLKSADKKVSDIGDKITYTLVLTNNGNVDAEGVVLYDTIPNGTVFINDSVTVNGSPLLGANPQSGIAVGNIGPSKTTTVQFKVEVVSIPESKAVVNSPRVSYNYTVDPAQPGGATGTGGGNTVTIPVNTAVIKPENGGLVKTVDKAYAGINEIITYTIKLTNTGTVKATNTKLFDTIPNGTIFVGGSVLVDNVNQNSNPQTGITIGTIKVLETRVVTFKVQVVTVPEPNPIKNCADVVYNYDTEEGI